MEKIMTSLNLPKKLLKHARAYCEMNEITFTNLVETLLREKFKDVYTQKIIYEDYSHLDAEDRPFNPKVVKIEEKITA